MNTADAIVQKTFKAALQVREKAYAPYSQFQVGAAAKLAGTETIITGCNVENGSYGATVCAERNLLFAAVAAYGAVNIEHLVVVTKLGIYPCALCLQVLQEFCPPALPIHIATLDGIKQSLTLHDFLPLPVKRFLLDT